MSEEALKDRELAGTLSDVRAVLMAEINKRIPTSYVDLERFSLIGPAISRMFKNEAMAGSPEKMQATLKFMAFAIAKSVVGQMRGHPEYSGNPAQHLSGEDEFRTVFVKSPIFDEVGLPYVGLNRSNYSKHMCPAVRSDGEKKVWLNWLLSQYVFTAALYGKVELEDAKEICSFWVAVQFDWLHVDAYLANKDFKRYFKDRG